MPKNPITLMQYLAQRIVWNEHYTKHILPKSDLSPEEQKTSYARHKVETYLLLHLYNWIKNGDIPLDSDVTKFKTKTPWDLYAMTIDNTIAPLPQDEEVTEELFI